LNNLRHADDTALMEGENRGFEKHHQESGERKREGWYVFQH